MNAIIMGIGMVFFVVFLIALVEGGKRYSDTIEALDKKQYSFRELYVIGYAILDIIKFDLDSEKNVEKINKLYALHGDRSRSKNHLLAVRAGQISYLVTVVPFACAFAAMTNQLAIILLGLAIAFLYIYDLEKQIEDALSHRKEELLRCFPAAVSKLTLLVNSGAIIGDAWEKTAYSGEGVLFDEMKQVIADHENGYTFVESYLRFAKRCGVKEIDKFTSIMIQNIDKGSKELIEYLRDITTEMWNDKKHKSKLMIDKINNKLMIPTFLIFAGILVLVMTPMFVSMMGAF